jgi:hypothetical protein
MGNIAEFSTLAWWGAASKYKSKKRALGSPTILLSAQNNEHARINTPSRAEA